MMVRFTRPYLVREGCALLVPVSMAGNKIYTFDLIDGIYTLEYDKDVFAAFERTKMQLDGKLVDCYKPRHFHVKQVLYRPHEMRW